MKYLALTIGPIFKILSEARKTRELWASSYLLSSLMKHIMQQLDPKGDRILIPKVPAEILNENLYGAGIYPDRLFMKADGVNKKMVDDGIEKALLELAKSCLLKNEGQTDEDKAQLAQDTLTYWQSLFRIHYVLKDLPCIENGKLSIALSPYLETAELEDTCFPEEPAQNELLRLFDINRIYNVSLSEGLQGDNQGVYENILSKNSYIPSTAQIASMELHSHDSRKLQEIAEKLPYNSPSEEYYEAIDDCESLGKHLMPRHKYFCIVQADGDSIGAAIKKLNTKEDYETFSETLAVFGQEAAQAINDFGGKPIYIGGDDLLFLAPVQNGTDNIFKLLADLDKLFLAKDFKAKVSLSYGVNIVYYKYPLFEAISNAYEIMSQAKKYSTKSGTKKNAVAFRFTKHSSSYFSGTFSKSFLSKVLESAKVFNEISPDIHKGVVSSLMFKIQSLQALLSGIAEQLEKEKKSDHLPARLQQFFDSFYNEWDGINAFEKQKKASLELLLAAYEEVGVKEEKWLSLFYAVMRLFDFIQEPNENQQNDTENISTAA